MAYKVDFLQVSAVGLESAPFSATLAGLRAHEARYFKTKYNLDFVVFPANESQETLQWVSRILLEERAIVIEAKPVECASLLIGNLKWVFVFYENGLEINIPYTLDSTEKRAVGFKLSDGMEIPEELASRFKFARMKSKLAGTIRGSFFVIKGSY